MEIDYKINKEIKNSKIRLLSEDGNSKVLSRTEALRIANEQGLDLVEKSVHGTTDPVSICIITDYSKFKYNEEKRAKKIAKESKKNRVVVKELQLRPVTDKNDISIKATKAQEFLNEGNKVKITVKFRGREMSFTDKGHEVLNLFLEKLSGYKFDAEPKINGRDLSAVIRKEQ